MRGSSGDGDGRLTVGAEVWSGDERYLGRVAEVTEDHFRLAGEDGHDRWLLASSVRSATAERAVLGFGAGELEDQAASPPADGRPASHVDDPTPHIDPGAAIPDSEEQREVMLRELSEQREQMREEGTATPEADRSIGEPVEQELDRRESSDDERRPR